MEEKERYYYKEYAGDYDILDRNDKNAYYGAISRDEEDAQNLINLLNQQSKRIKELEQENLSLQEQSIRDNQNWIEETTKLKQQLITTEKALELACEPRDDWGGEEYSGTEYDNYYDYFMAEAKEMLENE